MSTWLWIMVDICKLIVLAQLLYHGRMHVGVKMVFVELMLQVVEVDVTCHSGDRHLF